MANVFDSVSAVNIGTTPVTLFTATEATMIQSLIIGNIAATGIQVTVKIIDASNSNTVTIVKDAPIPVGSSLSPFEEAKSNLMTGDQIQITASVATACDAFMSIIKDINGN